MRSRHAVRSDLKVSELAPEGQSPTRFATVLESLDTLTYFPPHITRKPVAGFLDYISCVTTQGIAL